MKKTKFIEVDISQTLSSTQIIEVPEYFDETNNLALEKEVIAQIVLPSDCMKIDGYLMWNIDDFCVM